MAKKQKSPEEKIKRNYSKVRHSLRLVKTSNGLSKTNVVNKKSKTSSVTGGKFYVLQWYSLLTRGDLIHGEQLVLNEIVLTFAGVLVSDNVVTTGGIEPVGSMGVKDVCIGAVLVGIVCFKLAFIGPVLGR